MQSIRMWISWTQRPGSRVPTTHLQNLHTPVLLYGMALLLPSSKPLEQLELFQKRILKQILSLPMSCPDPAVYILAGILPREAQIHIKPSRSSITSVLRAKKTQKKLARRQLTVKEESNNSWFICVDKMLRKCDLKEAYNYLDNPIKNHDGSRW